MFSDGNMEISRVFEPPVMEPETRMDSSWCNIGDPVDQKSWNFWPQSDFWMIQKKTDWLICSSLRIAWDWLALTLLLPYQTKTVATRIITLLKDPNLHFCFPLVEELSQVNFLVAQEDCCIFGPLATWGASHNWFHARGRETKRSLQRKNQPSRSVTSSLEEKKRRWSEEDGLQRKRHFSKQVSKFQVSLS